MIAAYILISQTLNFFAPLREIKDYQKYIRSLNYFIWDVALLTGYIVVRTRVQKVYYLKNRSGRKEIENKIIV